jgi:hypothetical protein
MLGILPASVRGRQARALARAQRPAGSAPARPAPQAAPAASLAAARRAPIVTRHAPPLAAPA